MSILSTAVFTASLVSTACIGNLQENNAPVQNMEKSQITFQSIQKENLSSLQNNPRIQKLLKQCGITDEMLDSLLSGQCIIIRPGYDKPGNDTNKPGEDTEQPDNGDNDLPDNDDNRPGDDTDLPDHDDNPGDDTDQPDNGDNSPDNEIETPDFDKPGTDTPEDTTKPGGDGPVEDNKPGENEPGDNKPGDNETEDGDSENDNSYASEVISLVNAERAKYNLAPLTTEKNLSAAALTRAKEIVQSFSHTRPDGTSFSTVLKEHGISYRISGENIAWGQRTPQEVVRGWMNSPGHRANILNERFTSIGVGYHIENGRTYWTQLFT